MSDRIHNAYLDPYAQRYNAHKKRSEFEKQKRTISFKLWRMRQLKVQNGQCAYCRIPLSNKGIVTHIDHVTPLYHDGKNEYTNFVLSCRRCNIRKWTANNYVYPEWIKKNSQGMKHCQRLKQLRKNQQRLANEIISDMEYDAISWIT